MDKKLFIVIVYVFHKRNYTVIFLQQLDCLFLGEYGGYSFFISEKCKI